MRAAAIGGDGGGVDDRRPRLKMREGCLDKVEVGKNVGPKGPLELVARDFPDVILGVLFRGVVNQDIEAPKCFEGVAHRLSTYVFAPDVPCQGHAEAAFLLNL